jgi:peptidoglycan/xylan/chitin deacetylase (PgdA/CDA1 family)
MNYAVRPDGPEISGPEISGPAPTSLGAPASTRQAALKRSAETVVSLVFFSATTAWRGFTQLFGPARPRLVILYYHAVPAMYRARFARQLDAIRTGADAVVPADFCGPADRSRLLVAITFDDAFVSVVENALPELAARDMTATIFTPSAMLGRSPGWQMEASAEDRFERVASEEMLLALPQHVVTIGAHSMTHPHLPAIGRHAAEAEIAGSRSELSTLIGRSVDVFAFPYGEYDDQVVELCRSAGYRFAYTIMPREFDPADPSFLRGRIAVRLDDSPLEFWLKMRGAYSWLTPARRIVRRLLRRGRHRS